MDDRLIVALDVPNAVAGLDLAGRLGDAVGFYKIGLGMLTGGGLALAVSLHRTAERAVRPLAVFKQYREPDGRFYFKLVDGERVLLQSHGFDAPRDAGQTIARLRRGELAIIDAPATLGEGVDADTVQAALDALAAADAGKAAS